MEYLCYENKRRNISFQHPGDVTLSAFLTLASVHDSQAAIPMMQMSSQRGVYCFIRLNFFPLDPISKSFGSYWLNS